MNNSDLTFLLIPPHTSFLPQGVAPPEPASLVPPYEEILLPAGLKFSAPLKKRGIPSISKGSSFPFNLICLNNECCDITSSAIVNQFLFPLRIQYSGV